MPLNLTWKTCGDDGHWCSLEHLGLDSIGEVAGVYIIWHEGNPGRVVRLGQGDPIKDRLAAHRKDSEVLAYSRIGKLRVTWASVSSIYRDGVERHLADQLSPLIGDCFPNVVPIAVNYPW